MNSRRRVNSDVRWLQVSTMMSEAILILQPDTSLPLSSQLLLVSVMVVTGIVGWLVLRPLIPWIRRLVVAHKSEVDIIFFSIICILWGGGIWYLIVTKHAYSNTLAIVMASGLICVGIYSLAKRLTRHA